MARVGAGAGILLGGAALLAWLALRESGGDAPPMPKPPNPPAPSVYDLITNADFDTPAEPFAPHESEDGCDPTPKPGVVLFRDYVLKQFGGTDLGIVRACDQGGPSGHKLGRAWDWGVQVSGPSGKALLDWLELEDFAMFRRAGLLYMIADRRIFGGYLANAGWRPYSGADPHTGHVHLSFSTPGALGKTSLYALLRPSV